MNFHNKLINLRKERNISQEKLTEQIGNLNSQGRWSAMQQYGKKSVD